jgi:hypothetical protein
VDAAQAGLDPDHRLLGLGHVRAQAGDLAFQVDHALGLRTTVDGVVVGQEGAAAEQRNAHGSGKKGLFDPG